MMKRADHGYVCHFTFAELDLMYELARDARNNLPDPEDQAETGSWADKVIKLDDKLTTFYHQRRQ